MHKLLTPFAAGAALLLGACASTEPWQTPEKFTKVRSAGTG